MSPIGRVFIVLNLVLAAGFLFFAGTYLQRQDDYKKAYESEQKKHSEDNAQHVANIKDLQDRLTGANTQVAQLDTERLSLNNRLEAEKETNVSLSKRVGEFEATLKVLSSSSQGMSDQIAAAFSKAGDAYTRAIAAQQEKDAAVRAKDDAVNQAKEAALKITALEETVSNKDAEIAQLSQKNGELDLLVSVARTKGFLDSMAVPPLDGIIAQVNGRLVTIQVNNNPTNAEIKPGYKFALYDGTTYKGEARVTEADAEKGVAFATMEIVKGEVKPGDRASTQTN